MPSVTINGRLEKTGDVDGYAVRLDAGETLIAAVEAKRQLGSPMDAVLQVATPDGLVVEQVDDSGGLDPRLVFKAPTRGTYVVRTFAFPATPNSSIQFAGGSAYVYRLTLTTGPFADYAVPLSVPRENPGWVGVIGWNLPDEARTLPVSVIETAPDRAIASHPAVANPAEVGLVSHGVDLERPVVGGTGAVQSIGVPVSLTGRIASEGERDVYRFRGVKGQVLRIRVVSRTLGFPLDPVLRVLGEDDKVLAESDDADRSNRDSDVRFKPPADGEYRVEVRDLNGGGGSRFVYRLDLLRVEPDVALSLKSDRVTLTPGKPLEIAVAVDRRDGFDGTLTVTAGDLPEGVTVTAGKSEPKGDTAKSAKLTLNSEGGVAWSGPIRIFGRAESLPAARQAEAPIDGQESTTDRPWLTVLPPSEPEKKAADSGNDSEGEGK